MLVGWLADSFDDECRIKMKFNDAKTLFQQIFNLRVTIYYLEIIFRLSGFGET